MIMVSAGVMGALLGGASADSTGFTPVPYAVYLEQDWYSLILVAQGLYNDDKVTLTHKSTDNGVTYAVTNEDTNFGISTPVIRTSRFAEINISGNGIIAYTVGIWLYYKDGDDDWVTLSLSSIPGGAIGGGFLTSLTFDATNNIFIVNKNNGIDINTTPDFIQWTNPSSGETNPISTTHRLQTFSIEFIGGQYLAFGLGEAIEDSGDFDLAEVWSSPDLETWSQESPTLAAVAFGSGDAVKEEIIARLTEVSWFNSLYIVYGSTEVTDATDRSLHVFTSTDGIIWLESGTLSADAVSGQEGNHTLITSTGIEILTDSHVFRSADGTTWTPTLLANNLTLKTSPASNLHAAQAKGHRQRPSTSEAPDHIAVMNADILQLGGKILHLSETNVTPLLGYPADSATGAEVGFIQNNFDIDQIIDQGFTVKDSTAQSFLARNSGDRYLEVTINATSGSVNKIGLIAMVADKYAGSDEISVKLTTNLVEVSSGGDTVVVYTMAVSQVLGFQFDFAASQILITVDGVLLHTQSSVENLLSWVIECEMISGEAALNVGKDTFSFPPGGTVAWNT